MRFAGGAARQQHCGDGYRRGHGGTGNVGQLSCLYRVALPVVPGTREEDWRSNVCAGIARRSVRAVAGRVYIERNDEPEDGTVGTAGIGSDHARAGVCAAARNSSVRYAASVNKESATPRLRKTQDSQQYSQQSPTKILLLGLVITLAAVLAYAFYIT